MRCHYWQLIFVLLLVQAIISQPWRSCSAVGVNWGWSSSHPLPPETVVEGILRANSVGRVKLSDADPSVLNSLAGTEIGVMVGIPNEALQKLNASRKAAESWVHDNVTRYLSAGGAAYAVHIEYIAVGDEPFKLGYGQQFEPFVIGAATNIHLALIASKLSKIKVVVPCSSDAFLSSSDLPSGGRFRPNLNKTMVGLLSLLSAQGSPFVLDINPFSGYQQNNNISINYVLFQPDARPVTDRHIKYQNSFDLHIDTLVSALSLLGFEDMEIMVGRIGWPTDGAVNATPSIAEIYMKGLIDHLQSTSGTPLRPKQPLLETFLFSLLDEDQRSIASGNYERHWGIFTFDGQAKYSVDLGQGSKDLVNAQNVEYLPFKWCVVKTDGLSSNLPYVVSEACSDTDCTAVSPGGSCSGIGWPGNVSYALNSYYQKHDQSLESCDFGGVGMITTVDPSVDSCRFPVGIRANFAPIHGPHLFWWIVVHGLCALTTLYLFCMGS